jgi:hypothetical protein
MSADPENIFCLCYSCHINWWHKSPLDASEWFKKKFPERYKSLRLKSRLNKVVNWEKRWEEIKQNK